MKAFTRPLGTPGKTDAADARALARGQLQALGPARRLHKRHVANGPKPTVALVAVMRKPIVICNALRINQAAT